MNDAPPRKSLLRFLPILLIAAALALAVALRLHERLSLDTLYMQSRALERFVAANWATALGLYILIYAAATTISLPGAGALTVSGGFMFGTWLGGGAAWLGAMIGAHLLFIATRTAFGDLLRNRASGRLEEFRSGFERNAFSYLLLLRLTPVAPFVVVNLVPGFLGVSLRDYFLATAIGITPATFVYAAVGAGLRAALERGVHAEQGQLVRAIVTSPAMYGPLIALVALALLPLVIQRFVRKSAHGGTEA